MASEVLSSIKVLLSQLQQGEKNASDVVRNLNTWAREIGDLIKDKVEEEVERSVKKMGFVKREEYRSLEARVKALEAHIKATSGRSSSRTMPKSSGGRAMKKSTSGKKTQKVQSAGKDKRKKSQSVAKGKVVGR